MNAFFRPLVGLTSSIAAVLLVTSCSKLSAPSQSKLMSFDEFSAARLAPSPSADCDSACVTRRLEFRYVVYVGEQVYCYWDMKRAQTGTDFAALATRLEASIGTSTTTSEYFGILREWASAFHDGHVNAMPSADMTSLEIYSAPLRLEVLAPGTPREKVVVVALTERVDGLAVGDEITSVNGVPIADALTAAAAVASSGSTDRMRRAGAARRLVDVLGIEAGTRVLELGIQPFNGSAAKTVTVWRNVSIAVRPPQQPVSTTVTGAEFITAKILPGGIGYLRIDAFVGEQDEMLLSQAMDRLARTEGLIIDLRRNGGGDLSGDRILSRLTTSPIIRYKRSERLSDYIRATRADDFLTLTPDSSGLFAEWHDLLVMDDEDRHYSKPVVALIGPNCFSACDTFSSSLKDNQLATMIGEPTGGGTGTPLVFELPRSGFMFRYSVIRGQTPLGAEIEGAGTSPDVEIEPTVQDRVTGSDSQLVKAIDVLRGKMTPGLPLAGAPIDLSAIAHIWAQPLDMPPTMADMIDLRRISAVDER